MPIRAHLDLWRQWLRRVAFESQRAERDQRFVFGGDLRSFWLAFGTVSCCQQDRWKTWCSTVCGVWYVLVVSYVVKLSCRKHSGSAKMCGGACQIKSQYWLSCCATQLHCCSLNFYVLCNDRAYQGSTSQNYQPITLYSIQWRSLLVPCHQVTFNLTCKHVTHWRPNQAAFTKSSIRIAFVHSPIVLCKCSLPNRKFLSSRSWIPIARESNASWLFWTYSLADLSELTLLFWSCWWTSKSIWFRRGNMSEFTIIPWIMTKNFS